MTTVIIADDDPIILQGLSMIIASRDDLQLLGAGSNGREAVDLCRRYQPDVAVLDIRMPVMDGISAAREIIAANLSSPLLLTTFDEPDLIGGALDVGAKGYILKNSPSERIISAIVTVAEGGSVFAPDVIDYIRSVVRIPKAEDIFKALTPRENEIAALIAQGLSNAEIAEKLFLSNGTVRNHISVILEKTGLEHRTQIAIRLLAGM
jgi:DNA-binding NarL/FixJ family response regulator